MRFSSSQPNGPRAGKTEGKGHHDSDRRLVQRVLADDSEAMEEFVDRLACIPRMVRSQNRRLGTPIMAADLDDIAQNAAAAIWRKLEHYNGLASLEGWLVGFVLREVLKAVDDGRRRARMNLTDEPNLGEPAEPELDRFERFDRIERALQELPPPQDHIIRLKYFRGSTFASIAKDLKLPLGSVKTFYYRAMEQLRRRLMSLAPEVAE